MPSFKPGDVVRPRTAAFPDASEFVGVVVEATENTGGIEMLDEISVEFDPGSNLVFSAFQIESAAEAVRMNT